MIQKCHEYGFSLSEANRDGFTVLMRACQQNNDEVATYLLSKNVDTCKVNISRETALMLAMKVAERDD